VAGDAADDEVGMNDVRWDQTLAGRFEKSVGGLNNPLARRQITANQHIDVRCERFFANLREGSLSHGVPPVVLMPPTRIERASGVLEAPAPPMYHGGLSERIPPGSGAVKSRTEEDKALAGSLAAPTGGPFTRR